MASMSAVSGDFKNPGAHPGMEIWRIEKLHAVPIAKKEYGAFYSGDCYIVLNTYEDKFRKLNMDLFFWIGEKCSQDEKGAVAYKAVELDDQLGGKPVQHREVQGHESVQFTSLFPGGVKYQDGGIESAFNTVKPNDYKPRLFHLKGKRNVRVQQVQLASSSLNEGDVFILDAGLTLYQWNGKEANKYEKAKGLEIITKINGDERGGKAKLVFLDSKDDNAEFWGLLGGRAGVKAATADDDVKEATVKLLTVDGQVLAEGQLDRAHLSTEGVFFVDSGTQVFVWVGKNASKDQRAKSLPMAAEYLKNNNRPDWTPTTRVAESGEPTAFKALFKVWDAPKVVDFKAANVKKAQAAPDTSALFKVQKAAEEKMVDNATGKLKIWRIENFAKVELEASLYGQFFAGDSYIVLYTYKTGTKENAIIYFWQGRKSSQDEKGASALLTKQLDDEMNGQAVQVRVVQNKEPNHFLALFKGKMVVHEGGKASAFKNRQEADSAGAAENRLYHVRGTNQHNTHAVQVDCTAVSLNSGDCFVLGTPSHVYVWNGKGSNDEEQKVATNVGHLLASGRQVSSVNEGEEPAAFWEGVGGQQEYPTSKAMEAGDHDARLFQCSNSGAGFKITELFNFSQDDLVQDDVMLLDAFSEVYVWIGHNSNQQEKELSLDAALNYVKNAPDGRDPDTPVFLVHAGAEPPSFTCHFLGWDNNKANDFADPYAKKLAALKGAGGAAGGAAAADQKSAGPVLVKSASDAGLGFADPNTNKFSVADLKGAAVPKGVDPKNKEQYLSDADFAAIFKMSRDEFSKLPAWKKERVKKDNGLF